MPSEDTNTHLQHFLELCDTIVIKDITPTSIRLKDVALASIKPASISLKAKQWFYKDRKADMWDKCFTAFLTKLFPMGKTNALRGRISIFKQNVMETIPES